MATIDWPAELPQQFLIDGFDEKPAKFKVRTEMDAAFAKQRPRFTTAAHPLSGTMIMTADQYAAFKIFYALTLGNGCLEFNMPVPGDNLTTHVVRFTEEDYEPAPIGLVWRVRLNLEILS